MDQGGLLLPPGSNGEVVIRGPNVTVGYEGDTAASTDGFEDGWFRTGDLGRFDDDGYLFLTGRIKETINRGGESIAPREIDDALLSHPDVEQAVAYAIPHETLGEEVAAAVVMRAEAAATDTDLKEFVAERVALPKVPKKLIIVDEIPKGPTGKLQRIGLAERLAKKEGGDRKSVTTAAKPGFASKLEAGLAEIWADVLGTAAVGPEDEFVDLGGDSLSAVELYVAVADRFDSGLPMARLFEASTVRGQAALIAQPQVTAASSLVTLRGQGAGPPLFLVHGLFGTADVFYRLVAALAEGYPVCAFQARGVDGVSTPRETIPEMAAAYIEEMRQMEGRGPYHLAGHSFGGFVAYEMARQLAAAGEGVAFLGLFDTPASATRYPTPRTARGYLHRLQRMLRYSRQVYRSPDGVGGFGPLLAAAKRRTGIGRRQWSAIEAKLHAVNHAAVESYVPPPSYVGDVTLFRARVRPWDYLPLPADGWQDRVKGEIDIREIPGSHHDFITDHAAGLATSLSDALAQTQQRV